MEDKNLALGLIDFVEDVPGFWDELRDVVQGKFAVIAKRAEQLKKDLFESKDKFLNTIIDMIFVLKKTPVLFQGFFRFVLKGVMLFFLNKLDAEWLKHIREKTGYVKIVNAKVTIDV